MYNMSFSRGLKYLLTVEKIMLLVVSRGNHKNKKRRKNTSNQNKNKQINNNKKKSRILSCVSWQAIRKFLKNEIFFKSHGIREGLRD